MKIETKTEFLYGINVVNEVLNADKRKIFIAYISKTSFNNPKIKSVIVRLQKKGINITYRDKGFLNNIAATREHQGIVIETEKYPYIRFDELLRNLPDRLILPDNIEDPHNLGAIIRSAEVMGYKGILVPRKGTPGIYPSVVKASAGASEHLYITKDKNANQYFKTLKENNITTIVIDKKGRDIQTIKDVPERFLLIIGGEDKGVGQFILNNADITLSIPQKGKINSLNASTAAAISMFQLTVGVFKKLSNSKNSALFE